MNASENVHRPYVHTHTHKMEEGKSCIFRSNINLFNFSTLSRLSTHTWPHLHMHTGSRYTQTRTRLTSLAVDVEMEKERGEKMRCALSARPRHVSCARISLKQLRRETRPDEPKTVSLFLFIIPLFLPLLSPLFLTLMPLLFLICIVLFACPFLGCPSYAKTCYGFHELFPVIVFVVIIIS